MKPHPQGHALDNLCQEEIKPDFLLGNKPRSPSQYQDRDHMTYSEKEALKKLQRPQDGPNSLVTLEDNANTLQDLRKRTNIGKYSPYKSSSFKEKQPFRVDSKDNPKERVAEVTKKKNLCHNFGSTEHHSNNCPKAKQKVYATEQVPNKESPKNNSESYSVGDAIREPSDDDQDPNEEFLVEYQEETHL
ncbi:hypothetical protein O181_032114 [Austropuccinia psidii MF-1]|uniref:Uncharacterized protein n=1 Tax=Austropuccinia psidii MF-1 TaxID=1389203 RepID=A0A9Q3H782_9BASI|nr:hypothetical protein [Austropuccinia psidii MF-1]